METINFRELATLADVKEAPSVVAILRAQRTHTDLENLIAECDGTAYLNALSRRKILNFLNLAMVYLQSLPQGPNTAALLKEARSLAQVYFRDTSYYIDRETRKRSQFFLTEYARAVLLMFPVILPPPKPVPSLVEQMDNLSLATPYKAKYPLKALAFDLLESKMKFRIVTTDGELVLWRTGQWEEYSKIQKRYQTCIEKGHEFVWLYEYESRKLLRDPVHADLADERSGYCENCDDHAIYRCGRCLKATYCSVECQRAHWAAVHSRSCKPAEKS